VTRVHGLAVHERAAPHDGLDTKLPTRFERLGGDAASPERPVKPDAPNAPGGGFAHEGGPDGRMRRDEHAVYVARNRRQVGIRARPFEFRSVRVDGNRFMPALLEATEDGVRRRATRARDTGDDDALPGEEIGDGRRKRLHAGEVAPSGCLTIPRSAASGASPPQRVVRRRSWAGCDAGRSKPRCDLAPVMHFVIEVAADDDPPVRDDATKALIGNGGVELGGRQRLEDGRALLT